MTTLIPEVRLVTPASCTWAFRDSKMAFSYGKFGGRAELDPFPAYAHDTTVVMETLQRVTEKWPLGTPLKIWVAEREELGRSNGFSDRSDRSTSADGKEWHGHIFLSGKRIPPHPAVTRYLVAHEFGHHVFWWLERERQLDDGNEPLLDEYAEMRGVESIWGHGGDWHRAASEVFACDFRILIAEVEEEYWPHQGVERPELCTGARDWWDRHLELWGARCPIPAS